MRVNFPATPAASQKYSNSYKKKQLIFLSL
jgi:hypothetical protein